MPPLAALSITKHHLGPFTVGSQGSYRLEVVNHGPTPSPGPITVTDRLPAGLTYVSASGAGWTCSAAGAVVTCVLPSGLALNARALIHLVVKVESAAYPSVVNSATAAGPGSPPTSGTDTATVGPLVVLHGHKTLLSASNGIAKWQITVTNAGPQATVDPVVVSDHLDPGLAFSSASGPGWACEAAGQLVTCTHAASVTAGSSTSVVLVTKIVAATGTVVANVATVSGGGSTASTPTNTAHLTVPAASSSSGGLPFTGLDVVGLVGVAAALMTVGGALTWFTRRRRLREVWTLSRQGR